MKRTVGFAGVVLLASLVVPVARAAAPTATSVKTDAGPVPFAGAASAPAADVEAAAAATPGISDATGTVYYVDCQAAGPADGTIDAPFTTLAEASAVTLQPGDQMRFRRGSTCEGTYAPSGTGGDGEPVVIGAYDTGRLPVIQALSSGTAAVSVVNLSHLVVEDLELTIKGIRVSATNGIVSDVVIQRLDVRDVAASNGINVSASGARFDGLTIQDNTVTDIGGTGINVQGGGTSRPPADQPWPSASTDVLATRNVVRNVDGTGINIEGSESPVASWNTVRKAGMNNSDYFLACGFGVGFKMHNTNNALVEHNEVSDMVFKGPNAIATGCHGEAFDIIFNLDGQIVQNNYTHDNVAGFTVLCEARAPHRAVFRFNLSIDDGAVFGAPPCEYGTNPVTYNLDGIRMYNNTWVAEWIRIFTQGDDWSTVYGTLGFGTFEFRNNILYATSTESPPPNYFFYCGDDADRASGAARPVLEAAPVDRQQNCSNNLFFNMPTYGTDAVQGDPLFVDPSRRGNGLDVAEGFRVQPASPAICAGRAIAPVAVPASVATQDFFGNPIPDPPSIGFAQHACSS